MSYKRLAIIGLITVIIFIIAVFLWLNAGLIYEKMFSARPVKTEIPAIKPTVKPAEPVRLEKGQVTEEKKDQILDALKAMNEEASSTIPEEKKSEILDNLKVINNQETIASSTPQEDVIPVDRKKEILDALRALNSGTGN